jgi:hypothetical protein
VGSRSKKSPSVIIRESMECQNLVWGTAFLKVCTISLPFGG